MTKVEAARRRESYRLPLNGKVVGDSGAGTITFAQTGSDVPGLDMSKPESASPGFAQASPRRSSMGPLLGRLWVAFGTLLVRFRAAFASRLVRFCVASGSLLSY